MGACTKETIGLLMLISGTYGLSCLPCTQVKCRPPENCEYGTVKHPCGCCDECAKGPNEECGGPWGIGGQCAHALYCLVDDSPQNPLMMYGICVENKRKVPQPRMIEQGKYTKEGFKCIFPFSYENKVYEDCAPGRNGPVWCATVLESDNLTMDKWGRCA